MKQVILFTDGSCLGNPGAGGWACLLRWGSVEKELSGAEPNTTNNRMELQAVIAGLAALKEQCAVKVVTDSQYVQRAMTKHLARWAASGWRNSRGVPVGKSGPMGNVGAREQTSPRHLDLGAGPWRKRRAESVRSTCADCPPPSEDGCLNSILIYTGCKVLG